MTLRREEAVLADPGEVREADVRVVLMRGDAMHGEDRGVLFAEDGKLGFRGARSSFLLPAHAYERRIGHTSERQGGVVLDTEDGATLFMAPLRFRTQGFAALSGVLTVAEREKMATDDDIEWPSYGPIGRRAVVSYRKTMAKRFALIFGLYVLFVGGMGATVWVMTGLFPTIFAFMPLILVLPFAIALRAPSPASRSLKRSIPKSYWITTALGALVAMGWLIVPLDRSVLKNLTPMMWMGLLGGLPGLGMWVFFSWHLRRGKRLAASRVAEEESTS